MVPFFCTHTEFKFKKKSSKQTKTNQAKTKPRTRIIGINFRT